MKSLWVLNKYFYKYRFRLIIGVVFVTISVIFGVFPAIYVRESFDIVSQAIQNYQDGTAEINNSALRNKLLLYGAIIIGASLLKGLFMFFMRQTIIVVSRYIEYDMKNEIFDQYQKLSLAFYKRNNTGDLMNRIGFGQQHRHEGMTGFMVGGVFLFLVTDYGLNVFRECNWMDA